MFKAPFSFDGRIRRLEYGISILICSFINIIVQAIARESQAPGILILLIPILWFA